MAVSTAGAILGGVAAAGSIGGAFIGADASRRAARTQSEGAERAALIQLEAQREAIAAQREMFDLLREDVAPYREAGGQALSALQTGLEPGGEFRQTFDFTLGDFEADPGYQFRLEQGQKALERSASARGTLLGGRQLRELERFAQGTASDEFQRFYGRRVDEYNRFNLDRTQQFNRLAALAGLGQTATTTQAQATQATGANLANIATGTGGRLSEIALQAANARAAGQVGQASAYGNALNTFSQLALFGLGRYG